jgi:hypothetical protein
MGHNEFSEGGASSFCTCTFFDRKSEFDFFDCRLGNLAGGAAYISAGTMA